MASPDLVSTLRRRFAEHNRQVLAFSFLTLAAAVVLWGALYGASYWLLLVGLTVAKGESATVPPEFDPGFLCVAAALLFSAWLDRRVTPNERPPDFRPAGEIFMDFVLAIPRVTLAVWGNLSAWQHLSRAEFRMAAELLACVHRERRVPIHSTPLVIPDDQSREKIVFALLLLQVLNLQHDEGEIWLRLPGGSAQPRLGGVA